MNHTLTLSILLLAGSANAQYRPIALPFPGANNPVISLPKSLPSPLSGPLAGTPISLPTPTITPSLPAAAIPSATIPAVPARRVLPTISVQFAESAGRKEEPKKAVDQDAEKDRLDHIFDGEQAPQRPGRRINIPEREMEEELGL